MNLLFRLPRVKHVRWWVAVVLSLPLISWLAVREALLALNHWVFTLRLWWQQSFLGLTEYQGGDREADDLRVVRRLIAAKQECYVLRPHLFNLSDRMELVAGTLPVFAVLWLGAGELQTRLQQPSLPASL